MKRYTIARMDYYQANAESEQQAINKVKDHINNKNHMLYDFKDNGSEDCSMEHSVEFRVIRIES